jgi:hypothetical protein
MLGTTETQIFYASRIVVQPVNALKLKNDSRGKMDRLQAKFLEESYRCNSRGRSPLPADIYNICNAEGFGEIIWFVATRFIE